MQASSGVSGHSIFVVGAGSNLARAFIHHACMPDWSPLRFSVFHCVVAVPRSDTHQLSVFEKEFQQYPVDYEVVDFNDTSLRNAMRGCDYMFIGPSARDDRVLRLNQLMDVAVSAGIRHVVMISMLTLEAQSQWAKEFRQMEQILGESRIAYTILRCAPFMEWLYGFATDMVLTHRLTLPTGNGRFAPISVDDVGRLAANILRRADMHINKVMNVTGTQLVSGKDIARLASHTFGKRIEFEDKEPSQYPDVGEKMVDGLKEVFHLIRNSRYHFLADDAVRDLAGTEPMELTEFFARHSKVFHSSVTPVSDESEEDRPTGSERHKKPHHESEFSRHVHEIMQSIPSEYHATVWDLMEWIVRELDDSSRYLRRSTRTMRDLERDLHLLLRDAQIEDERKRFEVRRGKAKAVTFAEELPGYMG
jgi:uncharacterized protein YbjT (DUF2867 family)